MNNTFSSTNSTKHSANVTVHRGMNVFYVKCCDGSGNCNKDDFVISFRVGCVHDADYDCDGCVMFREMFDYIKNWLSSESISMSKLIGAIRFWKSGCSE